MDKRSVLEDSWLPRSVPLTVAQQSSVGSGLRESFAEGIHAAYNAERFGCTESRQESRATVNDNRSVLDDSWLPRSVPLTVAQQSSVGSGLRESFAEGIHAAYNAERSGCTESRQESRATVNRQLFGTGRFLVT